jgi:hypothetical protein
MIALVAAALLLQASQPPRAAARGELPVQVGTEVRPDTVTVGDPFVVTVRVRAPRGATIEFPAGPDSGGTVEALDPRQVTPADDTTATEATAAWRMAAWDVDDQPIGLPDVVVRLDGRTRSVSLGSLRVHVASVLPADSAQRVPKPARPLFEFGLPWWYWLIAALLAAGLIGLLWWLWRRRRRREPIPADPYADAEEAFRRLEALGLIAAGERGRHVSIAVEVLREYLARTIPEAEASLTTTELLVALRSQHLAPSSRLAAVLSEADLIKFARRTVTAERARELGLEARAIVQSTHDAIAAERRLAEAREKATARGKAA